MAAVSRRSALRLFAASGLGLVAGCRPSRPTVGSSRSVPTRSVPAAAPTVHPTPKPPIDPVVARTASTERALLAAYDATAATHPELAVRLAPLRADHVQHLEGMIPGSATASSTPTPSASPTLTAPPTATPTPAIDPSSAPLSPAAASSAAASSRAAATHLALVDLGALESAAAAARIDDLAACSGSLARVVASIGGCEAAHAALLTADP
jgi:hypothetical protein